MGPLPPGDFTLVAEIFVPATHTFTTTVTAQNLTLRAQSSQSIPADGVHPGYTRTIFQFTRAPSRSTSYLFLRLNLARVGGGSPAHPWPFQLILYGASGLTAVVPDSIWDRPWNLSADGKLTC